jgi:hypothetical protein
MSKSNTKRETPNQRLCCRVVMLVAMGVGALQHSKYNLRLCIRKKKKKLLHTHTQRGFSEGRIIIIYRENKEKLSVEFKTFSHTQTEKREKDREIPGLSFPPLWIGHFVKLGFSFVSFQVETLHCGNGKTRLEELVMSSLPFEKI